MNEDFVSFDLAKKLKEEGYNKPFYFYYRTDDECIHHVNTCAALVYSDKIDDEVVIAPTISQVLKWLREKGIFIEIHVHATFATKNKVAYWCRICRNSNGMRIKQIDELEASYADYEKAAMAGIEYCLDNLI